MTRWTDEPDAIPHVRHVPSRGDWPLIEHDLATRTQELTTSVKRIGERSLFLVGESIADGHWGLPQSAWSVGLEGTARQYHITGWGGYAPFAPAGAELKVGAHLMGSFTGETWTPRPA